MDLWSSSRKVPTGLRKFVSKLSTFCKIRQRFSMTKNSRYDRLTVAIDSLLPSTRYCHRLHIEEHSRK
jgi:hypothetical protein